jgi:hypothetical protein
VEISVLGAKLSSGSSVGGGVGGGSGGFVDVPV